MRSGDVGGRALASALLEKLSLPAMVGQADELGASFQALYADLYQQLALMIGEGGMDAVLRRALRLTCRQHPVLVQLRLGELGLDIGALWSADSDLERTKLRAALVDLLGAVLDTLSTLVGMDLLQALLLRRAGSSHEPKR